MPQFMNIDSCCVLIHCEDNPVRRENQLTKIHFEKFALSSKSATVREGLERINCREQEAKPPLCIQW